MTELGGTKRTSTILQNQDCTENDGEFPQKVRYQNDATYPFAFPVAQASLEQESAYNDPSCMNERTEEESRLHENSNLSNDGHVLKK